MTQEGVSGAKGRASDSRGGQRSEGASERLKRGSAERRGERAGWCEGASERVGGDSARCRRTSHTWKYTTTRGAAAPPSSSRAHASVQTPNLTYTRTVQHRSATAPCVASCHVDRRTTCSAIAMRRAARPPRTAHCSAVRAAAVVHRRGPVDGPAVPWPRPWRLIRL